ncbi:MULTISPECIES: hypothetical protein [Streptomyces]|uniref:2-dehydro-3-deoxy-D-gluconate 5-dehydrogenase n=1 Tax=Streptomyces chartreusis NRRL 3882 TaxID=1079985 RepID=A0A2N9BJT3_STRCX|nr:MULTISPECIES: hypothetical protein [Streptomyces]MYS89066.1 hypothetical protein [Streptomyces sp. SID5464]SOR83624.1 2-dehydro-3-deoxy-D-gluconate 5-dehydrogenase [Streptomyces chartreusis NRRL 3882]
MKAVVHRGPRPLEIESRAAEAPVPAKERGGRGVLGRIPAGRRRYADDLAAATVFLAFSAQEQVDGIVLPVDGGRPGR